MSSSSTSDFQVFMPLVNAPPRSNTRSVVVVGAAVLALTFGGLGTWMALAPLQTAAIAPGVAKVSGEIKRVQHLEGGIVREILVKDGTHVTEGQVLVQLDDTAAKSTLAGLLSQQRSLMATAARLEAEQKDLDVIVFPKSLSTAAATDPTVAETVASQLKLFNARREALESQLSVLRQRIAQGNAEIVGLRAQVSADDNQTSLLREEIKGLTELFEKGYATKPRLLALRRMDASVMGHRGATLSAIARAEQSNSEYEMRMIDLDNRQKAEIATQLESVRAKLDELAEKIEGTADVLARTKVRAPRTGIVTDLRVHTTGGVIGPGQKLLDIVPDGEPLIIESRVRPDDIDVVHAGLPAQIHLAVYNARNLPLIDGKVLHVSADRMNDDRTGQPYFLARIQAQPESLKQANVELQAGMPAEVMIVTGERTVLSYLTRPLLDSFRRGLKEQY
jgi:HlyD family secretion protein